MTQLATQPVPSRPGVTLDFLRISEAETMLRVRRSAGAGPNQLAALVPLPLLLPQASMDGGPLKAFAGIRTREGVPLGEVVLHLPGDAGVRAQERPPDRQFTGGESRAHAIMVGP